MGVSGKKLKELRQRAGLTQEELARRAKVSVSLIAKYEGGTARNPTAATLLSLARVLAPLLGVSVNQVLTVLARVEEEATQ